MAAGAVYRVSDLALALRLSFFLWNSIPPDDELLNLAIAGKAARSGEDRNVIDLLNADYTFVDERLARHCGIPNIHGS